MPWHPDVPDIPISKPKEIEDLELMDRDVLNSMAGVEVEETVEQIAHAVAKTYKKERGRDLQDCIDIVSVALSVTGSAIGGQVGRAMIASNEGAARKACSLLFELPEV